MKKIFYHIVLIILFIGANSASGQITLDNTGGKIKNSGTIKIKRGETKSLPDTLGGRIEFLQDSPGGQQRIPNIVYGQLVLKNSSKKIIDDQKDASNNVKNLVVRDSLIVDQGTEMTTGWIGLNTENVYSKGHVANTAKYSGPKQLVLNSETQSQDILGNGSYSNLKIDNPNGVNVKGGGFTVEESLTLSRGNLNNDTDNNFTMKDSSLIVRTVEGSLNTSPNFEDRINVTYSGSGKSIYTGAEIPDDPAKLQNLSVDNSGGIVMTKDITVNNELYVNSRIITELDDARRYILTFTSAFNPVFSSSPFADIEGTFRRTNLSLDGTQMLFNNKYTWGVFRNADAAGNVKVLNFRLKPRQFFSFADSDVNKVKRTFEIWGENQNPQDSVFNEVSLDIGYGWRYDPIEDSLDENMGLTKEDLVLKRWTGNGWEDIETSQTPQFSNDNNWIYSQADNVMTLGKFVIGMPGGGIITLQGKVFMEGPYYNKMMSMDLPKFSLLPTTPPDEYPYNKDSRRASIVATAELDSIVDWIVIELKNEVAESKYICALLKYDGTIIDEKGNPTLNLTKAGIDSGSYYVGILHRSHLPVYSIERFNISPTNLGQYADFTKTSNVYGKEGSLQPLDIVNGFVLYGMVAGDVDGDNDIDEIDYRLTWTNRDLQYQYSRYDINMSGYINTKDINFPWNNIGRQANIP